MKLEDLNKTSKVVLDCAIEVHRNLGLGLLERVY
ncbi:MAG: GxxExxY protein [Candidatus Cloacimonetes bacterium]|nr:GxxExxY protein [Candidatus Cloacimonadota bacterium]MCF7813789.1 GxxExxY protein [Candidatus Cloacimonadota bacterium]MCF7868339.1 GxxExxY protein [Candidatus Cloacimonadota bacterium]MCF7883813.1 GxxExxY protein [Candidatus Cloacimonadota bacterium]